MGCSIGHCIASSTSSLPKAVEGDVPWTGLIGGTVLAGPGGAALSLVEQGWALATALSQLLPHALGFGSNSLEMHQPQLLALMEAGTGSTRQSCPF